MAAGQECPELMLIDHKCVAERLCTAATVVVTFLDPADRVLVRVCCALLRAILLLLLLLLLHHAPAAGWLDSHGGWLLLLAHSSARTGEEVPLSSFASNGKKTVIDFYTSW
jgi:hypothetical protein